MRLNIGSGSTKIDGFDNWDIKDGKDARHLDLPDDSVTEIYASHILEHLPFRDTLPALKEWVRVLAPTGRLRVCVPDFNKIVNGYLTASKSADPEWTEGFLMGGQADENDFHRSIFQEQKLYEQMYEAGLERIRRFDPVLKDCSALPVSLNLEGWKPVVPGRMSSGRTRLKRIPDTHACMTLPRVCWTDPAFEIQPVCARLGINLTRSTGVYWDQKLTAAVKDALSRNAKYLVVFDYDSIFTDYDVVCLHDIMEKYSDIAALFPHQVKRENEHVMMTIEGQDGKNREAIYAGELDADVFDVKTGHFGCTFIRADTFCKIKEPWFAGEPCPNGSWDDGRIDPDIKFWYRLRESGLRACLAPGVCIGHLQLMVTWPTRQLTPIHQYITDYQKNGKPMEAY